MRLAVVGWSLLCALFALRLASSTGEWWYWLVVVAATAACALSLVAVVADR